MSVSTLRLLWLEEVRLEERQRSRNWRRNLRLRNVFEVAADNRDFIQMYRLTPQLFEELCRELAPLIAPRRRTSGISLSIKIMTTLAFYASGSYQRGVGMCVHSCVAQQTVSKIIIEVTTALNNRDILAKHIRFPQNLREREEIKQGYYEKFQIPGVIGSIDCTHVAMIRPRLNEERYFNRKYYHSRNVQMICDSNLNIIGVDGSFGGASHDSYIFQRSQVKQLMEGLHQQGENTWLLGDAGYPLRAYLMTPINNAIDGTPEGHYNILQKKARNCIERTFGVLKGRWRCLLAARELHYDPLTVGKIVMACCVLHNLCNSRRALPSPRLSRRARSIEFHLQRRPNIIVRPPRTAAIDLRAGREAQRCLVAALNAVRQG